MLLVYRANKAGMIFDYEKTGKQKNLLSRLIDLNKGFDLTMADNGLEATTSPCLMSHVSCLSGMSQICTVHLTMQ